MVRTKTNPLRGYVTLPGRVQTPQSMPIPGQESEMIRNNAGGYSYSIDNWKYLDRFLILGTEGGTYYVGEQKLTRDAAKNVKACIKEDGVRVVNRAVELSDTGRAPKLGPILFTLALAISIGNKQTKRAVIENLPKAARIGTHLYDFVQYATQFRGWGRALREAVSNWYLTHNPRALAYDAIKYQSRNGWSHRDLLRLSHTKTTDRATNDVFHWMVRGWDAVGEEPHPDFVLRQIWAFEQAKKATSEAEIVRLINEYNLPRECVPTQFLKSPEVWNALLQGMPMTAMIRNLATMTRVGLLAPFSEATRKVVAELSNEEKLAKARVHPIGLLSAQRIYRNGGRGGRSHGETFSPIPQISDALEDAFTKSFKYVTPSGKNILIAVDVSGSMHGGEVAGVPGLSPHEAAGTMALVTAQTEPNYSAVMFENFAHPWNLSKRASLESVQRDLSRYSGGTNCASPINYATDQKLHVDGFVLYTDSETWAGYGHPSEALVRYNKMMGKQAKMVVVALTPTRMSVARQEQPNTLDVLGFDTYAPDLISGFLRGDF